MATRLKIVLIILSLLVIGLGTVVVIQSQKQCEPCGPPTTQSAAEIKMSYTNTLFNKFDLTADVRCGADPYDLFDGINVSLEACGALCDLDPHCQAFEFNNPNGHCSATTSCPAGNLEAMQGNDTYIKQTL